MPPQKEEGVGGGRKKEKGFLSLNKGFGGSKGEEPKLQCSKHVHTCRIALASPGYVQWPARKSLAALET